MNAYRRCQTNLDPFLVRRVGAPASPAGAGPGRTQAQGGIHLGNPGQITIRVQAAGVKGDMLTVVKGVASTAAPDWQLRIVDSPHPYTKGGMEVNAVKDDRDIEILECGLIQDEILARAGLDPATHSGWALGMGLDRLLMTLKGLPDIRYLRSAIRRLPNRW